jgi:diguanylate cyclase (GGDEF)-like protein/PAS domain S-box-containing protein
MAKDRPSSHPQSHGSTAGSGVSSQPAAPDRQAFLGGFPGAAVLVGGDGTVIAANSRAAGLQALIQHKAAPDINTLIETARNDRMIGAGAVTLKSAKGEIILDVTVVPSNVAGELVVMARDLTMERNLRTALVDSRQRYKDLVEVSSDFSWEIGTDGQFTFVTPRGALGYTGEELIGRKAEEFVISPEEFSPLPFVSDRPLDDVEVWMRGKDGSTACVQVSCVPLIASENGVDKWQGTRGVCRDVTDKRENESALARARHREQHLSYIVSTIRDELEPHNMLNAAAAATARALGMSGCRIYRRDERGAFAVAAEYGNVQGLKALDAALGSMEASDKAIELTIDKWQVLATPTNYRQAVNGALSMWKPADGEPWEDDHHILIRDVANQLGIANEQISNHERIVNLSRTDSMTGLLNRRAFYEEELPRRIARLERNGETAALFYVDMDNFKAVNDIHGHQMGDDAIMFLRDLLMEMSRPGDVIARLGGDEFAMWLDGVTPDVSTTRAERLIEASKTLRKFSGSPEKPLGISVGVAIFDPEEKEPLADLLARADAAMYAVKNAGKGGFRMAVPAGTALAASEGGDTKQANRP